MHDRVKILSVAAVSVCFALLSGTLISLGQQYPEGTLQVAQGSLAPDQTVATVTPNSELRYPVSQPLVDDLEETEGPQLLAQDAANDGEESGEEREEFEEPEESSEVQSEEPVAPEPIQPRQLNAEMIKLRDSVRRVLAANFAQPFNTRDNTPGEVLHFCLAFGADADVRYGSQSGKKVNGIGSLCWNYPFAGYKLLRAGGDRVVARIGYGLQERPSQFLAVLAQSGVPSDYQLQVGQYRGTVADLVEQEKLDCRGGTDLSFKLIGLSEYVKNGQSWKNDLGEDWSVERLVLEELERSPDKAKCDVTNRLAGLSHAIDRRINRNQPLGEAYLRAQNHVAEFQDFALGVQNPDGTWHPQFFAFKGTSNDTDGVLSSTGHILQWLVFSLPDDRLEDPRVVRSVIYLNNLLAKQSTHLKAGSTSSQYIGSVMYALRALRLYDQRLFKPCDPEPTPEQAAAESATAGRTRSGAS